MKKDINVWEYAGHICEQTGKGILVTTKVGDKVNSMTIGWGTLGIEWGRPIYTVFVREAATQRKCWKSTENLPLMYLWVLLTRIS